MLQPSSLSLRERVSYGESSLATIAVALLLNASANPDLSLLEEIGFWNEIVHLLVEQATTTGRQPRDVSSEEDRYRNH